jgi:competence protein ComFC
MLRSLARAALDTLFPAACLGCGRRGTALCAECRRGLPYLPEGLCGRCAGQRIARGVCRGCRQLSPRLHSVRAAFTYAGAARAAVLALKFRSGRNLAPLMGELMREALARQPLAADLVVPVPLAPGRLRARGYNQALLLAREVAGGMPDAELEPRALRRSDRKPQQTLSAAERLSNLRGAIGCDSRALEKVRGKRVLVVDDVVTTGATLSACAEALAGAGAARVWGLAFARDL